MVPSPGLEPGRGCPQWCLRPRRLPFRQLGAAASYAEPWAGVPGRPHTVAVAPAPVQPPARPRSLTGVASVLFLVALGVLFLPGPDVWRFLGGTLFIAAAVVTVVALDRR